MTNNPYGQFSNIYPAGRVAGGELFDEGLRKHMLRVFNYMTLGLVVTGVVALLTASNTALMQVIFGTPLKWVVMLAPLAFTLVLSFGINRLSAGTAQLLFWAFSAVMGLSLSAIFLVFTGASIAKIFFISAGMFAATALWGYTTKRDLTNFGAFLVMGLIGIMIAGLVNIFLQSSMMQFVISGIGVLVFTGLTAYDTQSIKEAYAEEYGSEANNKMAVMGALSLYLNFINMFTSLLQLFGDRE